MKPYVTGRSPARAAVAALAVVATLAAGGCGGTAERASAPDEATPEETVTKSPRGSGPGEGSGRGPARGRDAVADAVADLARRLGVEPSAITVATVEEVTWRDGSIGCPQPGMMYPQVLTDGSRVVLEAEGRRYEYHAGGRRSAFLCENPEPPAGR
jgi:hypothetical protein